MEQFVELTKALYASMQQQQQLQQHQEKFETHKKDFLGWIDAITQTTN